MIYVLIISVLIYYEGEEEEDAEDGHRAIACTEEKNVSFIPRLSFRASCSIDFS